MPEASSSSRVLRLGRRRALGGEVQLDLAGRAQDRGARVRERLVERGHRLVDVALRDRRHLQDTASEQGAAGPRARTSGQHLLVEHRLHLRGRPGQEHEQPAARPRRAGREPCRAGSRARRAPSMTSACFSLIGGHRAVVPGEARLQGLEDARGRGASPRPRAAAAASRVRSSSVGPRPPVAITMIGAGERGRGTPTRAARDRRPP